MSAPIAATWAEVLAGLTGARLASYDELLHSGTMDFKRLQSHLRKINAADLIVALDWLLSNKLIIRENGCFSAVSPSLARERFEKSPVGAPV